MRVRPGGGDEFSVSHSRQSICVQSLAGNNGSLQPTNRPPRRENVENDPCRWGTGECPRAGPIAPESHTISGLATPAGQHDRTPIQHTLTGRKRTTDHDLTLIGTRSGAPGSPPDRSGRSRNSRAANPTSPTFRYLHGAANPGGRRGPFGKLLWSAWQSAAEYLSGSVESELLKDLALACR